jgi:glutamyl/glutaminyl-tRNA synthetase
VTVTRIAPSPSGFLHLGNAVNFLLTRWVADAEPGSRLLLRIDDLALPIRTDHLADVFWAVDWLGIPITDGPKDPRDFRDRFAQRDSVAEFRNAAAALGPEWTYACECSRTTVARRGRGVPDPCADARLPWVPGRTALRFRAREGPAVDPATIAALARLGVQRDRVAAEMGDFVVWRRDDLPSYQLISVLCDEAAGVDTVVRGRDLLPSSAAQLLLAQPLGARRFSGARFVHHDLVDDARGAKLSKRDNADALRAIAERPDGRAEVLSAATAVADRTRDLYLPSD